MLKSEQTKVFIFTLLSFILFSSLILSIPASADDSVVTEVQLSVPISCSLSGTGMESHNAEVVNGRTQENIGLTTIKAYCNDPLGFAIYAIGYTDNTYGKTVLTDSELGSTYDIATSSTVVDATSSWSMKLAAMSGTYAPIIAGSSTDTLKQTGDPDFSSYQAVPTTYTKVAYRTASTDIGTSATGSSVTTTYKVHISPTQAAGNYVGQVKYTMVHPSIGMTPSVYCNPDGTTISTIGCMQDLNPNNKASVLASMAEEQQYTLRDSRDNKVYYVSKLKDGNIWMTQNLDFDIDSSKTYTPSDTDLPNGVTWTPDRSTYQEDELDSWNADRDNDWNLLQSYDEGDLYYDTSGMTTMRNITNYINSCGGGTCDDSIYNLLPSEWQDYIDTCDASFSNCDNSLQPEMNLLPTLSDNGDPHRHVGNLYSFTAAVAMNDDIIDMVDEGDTNINISNRSICPAGWRLPVESGNGSLHNLFLQYDFDENKHYLPNAYNEPLYFALAGVIEKGEINFEDAGYGLFYSSSNLRFRCFGITTCTDYNWDSYTWTLGFDSGEMYDDDRLLAYDASIFRSNASDGYSVRCVAR